MSLNDIKRINDEIKIYEKEIDKFSKLHLKACRKNNRNLSNQCSNKIANLSEKIKRLEEKKINMTICNKENIVEEVQQKFNKIYPITKKKNKWTSKQNS